MQAETPARRWLELQIDTIISRQGPDKCKITLMKAALRRKAIKLYTKQALRKHEEGFKARYKGGPVKDALCAIPLRVGQKRKLPGIKDKDVKAGPIILLVRLF